MKFKGTAAFALALFGMAGAASAGQHRYAGIHPIGDEPKDGFCFLEVPHVHAVAPAARVRVLYETRAQQHDFIGDPVPFGFDGTRYAYQGHHPVAVELEAGGDSPFCYIEGPHHHEVRPGPTAPFELKADVYVYTGPMPVHYVRDTGHHQRVNVIYRPLVAVRPVVMVEPSVVVKPPVALHVDLHLGSAPPPVVRERTVVVVEDHDHHPGKHKGHHKHKSKHKKHHR